MSDSQVMHCCQTIEDLFHVRLYFLHRHGLFILISLLEFVLETAVAALNYCVLYELISSTVRVEEINHLDDVWQSFNHA